MNTYEGVRFVASTRRDGEHFRGYLLIGSGGLAWEAVFGSMGRELPEFLSTCDPHYVASKMESQRDEIDWDAVSLKCECEIDETTAWEHDDELTEAYGPDWCVDLPRTPTYRFRAAKEAAAKLIEWARMTHPNPTTESES